MKRWETWLALAAVVCASLSTVPLDGRPRPALALAAIALLGLVGLARLRSALTAPKSTRGGQIDAYERALRIQEAREHKFRR